MGLIVQKRALDAAGGLRQVLLAVRKHDKARFASACGSAKEVRVGLRLAVAYGYVTSTNIRVVDTALDEVCAMCWRLSGR